MTFAIRAAPPIDPSFLAASARVDDLIVQLKATLVITDPEKLAAGNSRGVFDAYQIGTSFGGGQRVRPPDSPALW